jgi:hypothetical protein
MGDGKEQELVIDIEKWTRVTRNVVQAGTIMSLNLAGDLSWSRCFLSTSLYIPIIRRLVPTYNHSRLYYSISGSQLDIWPADIGGSWPARGIIATSQARLPENG